MCHCVRMWHFHCVNEELWTNTYILVWYQWNKMTLDSQPRGARVLIGYLLFRPQQRPWWPPGPSWPRESCWWRPSGVGWTLTKRPHHPQSCQKSIQRNSITKVPKYGVRRRERAFCCVGWVEEEIEIMPLTPKAVTFFIYFKVRSNPYAPWTLLMWC